VGHRAAPTPRGHYQLGQRADAEKGDRGGWLGVLMASAVEGHGKTAVGRPHPTPRSPPTELRVVPGADGGDGCKFEEATAPCATPAVLALGSKPAAGDVFP